MSPAPHLLAARDGRLLAAVQLLHALAQGITIAAIPWAILESGGSVTGAGLVLTATFLPFVALGLPAGLVGDRVSRRAVFAVALAAQTVVALVALGLVGVAGSATTAVLFCAALLMGSGRVFVDAGMFGSLGALVPREGMLSAQATVSSAFNLGYYGGPALGGLVIAISGLPAAFGLMALSTAVGAVLALRIGPGVDRRADEAPGERAMSAGLRLLFTEPTLRALAVVAVTWSVMSAGVITLAIPHLRRDLGLDGTQVSIVLGAGVAAMMLAPVVLHRAAGRVRDTRILTGALVAYLVPATVFATAGGVTAAAIAYGPLMFVTAVCAATIMGARARRTPVHLQALAGVSGRMLVISGFTAGSALASAAVAVVPPGTVYAAIGLGMLVLGVAAMRALDRSARPAALPALGSPRGLSPARAPRVA